MPAVHKRAGAKRDLIAHYVYLAEEADIETAERFLRSANESFEDLSKYAGMGPELSTRSPALAKLRKLRVGGFESFLIFYLPKGSSVSIVRVLHATQDWWALFGIL